MVSGEARLMRNDVNPFVSTKKPPILKIDQYPLIRSMSPHVDAPDIWKHNENTRTKKKFEQMFYLCGKRKQAYENFSQTLFCVVLFAAFSLVQIITSPIQFRQGEINLQSR